MLLPWIIIPTVLMLMPWQTLSQGYLPQDDALRHAAKALSGKTWQQILVMRPEITVDQQEGWHWVLGVCHRALGLDADSLVSLAVTGLFTVFVLAGLYISRCPVAFALGLLLVITAEPAFIERLSIGRPLLLTTSVALTVLHVWTREPRSVLWTVTATILGIGVTIWIHGMWYIFALPIVALVLSGHGRSAQRLAACWIAGCVVTAVLSGRGFEYFFQQWRMLTLALGQPSFAVDLVGELQPAPATFPVVALVAALILASLRVNGTWESTVLRDPFFMLAVLGWIGGLRIARFYLDWALPALVIWSARQVKGFLDGRTSATSWERLGVAGLAVVALTFAWTGDVNGRWSRALRHARVSIDDPALDGWLPGDGGIIYSRDMSTFYTMFFQTPRAPWCYVLGFEPGLMRPEDQHVLRDVQWRNVAAAYEPWLAKMTRNDRFVIHSPSSERPPLPSLEWKFVATDTWIGRIRRP